MTRWWDGFPWRQIQTNLREIDMLDIDADQVVADLQAFQANILMINAAGIIASYPTELPFHFQSPYLTGDSLETIIAACHAADIRVVARTDFSKVRRPIYEMYPEWAYISTAGQIVDYNGDVAVCLNGDYQQKYAIRIIEECLSQLAFDGIFFNMGGYQVRDYSGNYYGPCQCDNCRRGFAEMFGLPLPVKEDMNDPAFRKYVQFKNRTLHAHRVRTATAIQQKFPHVAIASHREIRDGFQRQESNTAIARPLPHWQYSGSDNTKWVTGSYPALISSNTTVDFIDFPYRHVAVSPHQQKLRLIQSLANGGALDFYLIGRLDNHADRSGFAPVKEMFHYHAANEESYRGLTSQAEIGLLNGSNANTSEFRGWFRFLVEGHFLFDTLVDESALELDWTRYRALILPDFQGVSDGLARRIDDFVAKGGVLIASGRSGFRDENFDPWPGPALSSLGIDRVLTVRSDMTSSYLKLNDKTGFGRFADTDLLYLDGPYIYAAYAAESSQRFQLIPPHNFGPPERCYYEQVTEHPGFVVHPFGAGKTVYLPWLPGQLFHRQGYPNTSEFIADLLENVAGLSPVGGNLSPMVEVTCYRSEAAEGAGHELVHLVNGSGHFGVSFFAPVTMRGVEVVIPRTEPPASVTSLVTGAACAHAWNDGQLTLRVDELGAFEALRIE